MLFKTENPPMDQLDYVKKLIVKDLKDVPYFIDLKKESNKNSWSTIQLFIRIFSKLLVNNFLSDRKINDYVIMSNDCIIHLLNITNEELMEIEISHFIMSFIESYERVALRLELFECVSNISKFRKMYKIIS